MTRGGTTFKIGRGRSQGTPIHPWKRCRHGCCCQGNCPESNDGVGWVQLLCVCVSVDKCVLMCGSARLAACVFCEMKMSLDRFPFRFFWLFDDFDGWFLVDVQVRVRSYKMHRASSSER